MLKWLYAVLAFILILSGCAKQEENAEAENKQNQTESTDMEEEERTIQEVNDDRDYVDNPQAPDTRSLNEIGDQFEDEDGNVTLEAITDYQKMHSIGPIQMSIRDVKVVNFSPAMHLVDYFHGFTHNEENFNYIKMYVTIENTSDQMVNFAPVSILETEAGEKKDFEDDFYLQNLYGDLSAGQKKTGELAFILEETNTEQIGTISLITSDVFDKENQSIEQGKEITIEF
ncbi:hypothetical protein [Virgibacillus salexigens]|uniref:hypothetical protein n=1 Tax=Virgibacillus salexigens TaxID=61016 RepID=UPI0019097A1B|nr:hypothetical protein [Virgibacillus salexigens]